MGLEPLACALGQVTTVTAFFVNLQPIAHPHYGTVPYARSDETTAIAPVRLAPLSRDETSHITIL